MFKWKIYEGPKLIDVVNADNYEEAVEYAKNVCDRFSRVRVVYAGVASAMTWAPFLSDIPDEIWKEAAA